MFLIVSQEYELFGTHRNEGDTQGKLYVKLSSQENRVELLFYSLHRTIANRVFIDYAFYDKP